MFLGLRSRKRTEFTWISTSRGFAQWSSDASWVFEIEAASATFPSSTSFAPEALWNVPLNWGGTIEKGLRWAVRAALRVLATRWRLALPRCSRAPPSPASVHAPALAQGGTSAAKPFCRFFCTSRQNATRFSRPKNNNFRETEIFGETTGRPNRNREPHFILCWRKIIEVGEIKTE